MKLDFWTAHARTIEPSTSWTRIPSCPFSATTAKTPVPLIQKTNVKNPPDYRDRNLVLGARNDHLTAGQRVLPVDDSIDTGGQAVGVRAIVEQAGATWCGAAVVIDELSDNRLRRELGVKAILNVQDL